MCAVNQVASQASIGRGNWGRGNRELGGVDSSVGAKGPERLGRQDAMLIAI